MYASVSPSTSGCESISPASSHLHLADVLCAWEDARRPGPDDASTMTLYSIAKQIYSLDTLDTRLTTSSKTPSKDANELSAKSAGKHVKHQSELPAGASPSRWGTAEFYVYLLVFVVCVPLMYKAVWDVSQPQSEHYSGYEKLLSDGWLFGRKVDNSDGQYAGFRDNIPYLSILLIVHPLLRRAYNSLFSSVDDNTRKGTLISRINFDFVSGLVFIAALHGFSALKVVTILYINYCIAMRLPRNVIPAATWTFNIGVLFANELTQGYHFSSLTEAAAPFYAGAPEMGKFLDSYGGLIPRWEVLFNITILRLIAFNMDYYWSLARDRSGSPIEVSPPATYAILPEYALIHQRRNS